MRGQLLERARDRFQVEIIVRRVRNSTTRSRSQRGCAEADGMLTTGHACSECRVMSFARATNAAVPFG